VEGFFHAEERLTGKKITSLQRVLIASKALKDYAARTWTAQYNLAVQRKDLSAIPNTWSDFRDWVNKEFGELNAEEKRFNRLIELEQTGTVQAYATKFMEAVTLSSKEPVSNDMKVRFFMRGLDPIIRGKWYEQRDRPTKLEEIIPILADLELSIKTGQVQEHYQNHNHSNAKKKKNRPSTNRHQDAGDPMELNAIAEARNAPKKSSPGWKLWCRKHNACYECGSKKHLAKDCSRDDRNRANGRSRSRQPNNPKRDRQTTDRGSRQDADESKK
jgi:hypothetical protein